ncbi:MAG TPA: T9SS type A sorting domain-containing protein [Spirochaetota bacterium]|nr:T9SS type A sorting domain-containing protein [Spirochaetota bacterium]
MKRYCFSIIIVLILSVFLYAGELDNICAYPVPFNPKKHSRLTIGYPSGFAGGTNYNVKVEIFDINGDLVIKKNSSSFPLYWNGRNSTGRHVKPGLYILKVVAENDNTYWKKNIRILVNY